MPRANPISRRRHTDAVIHAGEALARDQAAVPGLRLYVPVGRIEMPRVTHVVFDMDDVLAVRSTEATCASLAKASGLSATKVMERLYVIA